MDRIHNFFHDTAYKLDNPNLYSQLSCDTFGYFPDHPAYFPLLHPATTAKPGRTFLTCSKVCSNCSGRAKKMHRTATSIFHCFIYVILLILLEGTIFSWFSFVISDMLLIQTGIIKYSTIEISKEVPIGFTTDNRKQYQHAYLNKVVSFFN